MNDKLLKMLKIIFILLGVVILYLEFAVLYYDGILGLTMTLLGIGLIVTGVFYKCKDPMKILEILFEFFI
ncbi:hypothetical protein RH915_03340 [Serpentinicella sp. ANB-PHB4]|uniref:hypothetical protein n=1 Tax=Serpentinicella sp. ANB-PHB4 TaxID=3074076 RepID=UPI002854EAC2|nr:hypothetical protein [Serpentinicella sp. ANB-PHB4]MDR5658517.1 hypothetical protein [Serpentinicella sp. ANB-PHB4]